MARNSYSLFNKVSGWLRFGRGYDGAKDNRLFRNWAYSWGSPDGEIIRDLAKLRARSRDLYRNNAVGRGAVDLMTSNVIGRGLRAQSSIDREIVVPYLISIGYSEASANRACDILESKIEKRFHIWADSQFCDARNQFNFYQLQQIAYSAFLQSGEVFAGLVIDSEASKKYRFKVGLIEADQVQSPVSTSYASRTDRGGIEVDSAGKPIAAWVNYNQEVYPPDFKKINFFGSLSGRPLLLHIFMADRPGQTRGVPFLAPVITVLKQLGDYKLSELIRAKVVSFFSVFIKSSDPAALENGNGILNGQSPESVKTEGRDYVLGPGVIQALRQDEDVVFANPGNITSNYEPTFNAMLTETGMALRTPYEILRSRFDASFSASRGAKAEFWKEVQRRRKFFETRFCQVIFREWLTEEVLSGNLFCPGFLMSEELREAYFGSSWSGESMGLIDPEKELKASILKVQAGYSTATEETAAMTGNDYEKNLRIQAREKSLREKYGLSAMDVLFYGAANQTAALTPVPETAANVENSEVIEEENLATV